MKPPCAPPVGASTAQLVRSAVAEPLLLSAAGCLLGLLLATLALPLLAHALPSTLPLLHPLRMDAPLVLFAIGASLVVRIALRPAARHPLHPHPSATGAAFGKPHCIGIRRRQAAAPRARHRRSRCQRHARRSRRHVPAQPLSSAARRSRLHHRARHRCRHRSAGQAVRQAATARSLLSALARTPPPVARRPLRRRHQRAAARWRSLGRHDLPPLRHASALLTSRRQVPLAQPRLLRNHADPARRRPLLHPGRSRQKRRHHLRARRAGRLARPESHRPVLPSRRSR